MNWYSFKNKKVQGYCLGKVAKFAGYPVEELRIERVKWNGQEFEKISNNLC